MTECSTCGTELAKHEMRCPTCGKPTAFYHRQRRCLHCGAPAAERAKTCMMCHKPVDSLPPSVFGGSWRGIVLGGVIIAGLVYSVIRSDSDILPEERPVQAAVALTATPTPTSTSTVTPTPSSTNTPLPTITATPTATPTPQVHVVSSGENPSYIADLYGITVEELLKLNNIDDVTSLRVGQELILPPSTQPDPERGPDEVVPQIVYIIEPGDTLLGIALEYGTSVNNIKAINPDLDLDLIFPGQGIVIPLATPTNTPTPTVTPTATFTPGPYYAAPTLLTPVQYQVVTEPHLLFNWTASGVLTENEFYVLYLAWPDGSFSEQWTKQSSWRLSKELRRAAGPIVWRVGISRQTGTAPDGTPIGDVLVGPNEERTVDWP